MRLVDEPTYQRFITGELRRFDDRNTAFSRGAVDGQKYTRMHDQSLANLAKAVPGKTILDHATWVAGRTGDYTIRRAALGREHQPYYNRTYRLRDPNPAAMSRIVKQTAAWIGADRVGIARLNPLWIYTHWGMQNVHVLRRGPGGRPDRDPTRVPDGVVMIHRMDYDVILRSPAVEHETDIGYSKAAWSAASLATFITELGYKAIPACNELGISIAMAVDAGLGETGTQRPADHARLRRECAHQQSVHQPAAGPRPAGRSWGCRASANSAPCAPSIARADPSPPASGPTSPTTSTPRPAC